MWQPSQVNFTTLWQVDPDVNLLAKNNDGTPFRVLADSASTTTNPLYLQHYRDNRTRRARSLISTSGHFNPFTWLTFTGDMGYDRLDDITDNYTPPGIPSDNDGGVGLGSLRYREDETDSYNGSLRGTLLRETGDGDIEYRRDGADPLGLPDDLPERMTSDEALAATFDTDHPDGLVQIAQLYRSARAGDITVSALPG